MKTFSQSYKYILHVKFFKTYVKNFIILKGFLEPSELIYSWLQSVNVRAAKVASFGIELETNNYKATMSKQNILH